MERKPVVPAVGALMMDTTRRDGIGEFRGLAGPYWSLRPVGGGAEWEVVPECVRSLTPAEWLSAETARQNARSSRGAL